MRAVSILYALLLGQILYSVYCQPAKKILVFSRDDSPFSIALPAARKTLGDQALARKWQLDFAQDTSFFVGQTLHQYDAVVFLLTNGLALNSTQLESMQRYINSGGGFAGVLAANPNATDWNWYSELIGTNMVSGEPLLPLQNAEIRISDRIHPSTRTLPAYWSRSDVWINYDNSLRNKVHILAIVNERTFAGGLMGPDHPIAWCRQYDGGRSWYTSGGAIPAAWLEPDFTNHVLQGISWAAGESAGDCTATVNTYFERRVIDDKARMPMELAPTPDGRVIYVERAGAVKLYDPNTEAVVLSGQLNVNYDREDGLLGIAIDPNFSTNNWVYMYYTPNGLIPENILSRFTMIGDTLDVASEIVVLRIPTQRLLCCHSGGHLLFDNDGNLWLTVGDNTSPYGSDSYSPIDERPGRYPGYDAQSTSANTNDLRGKILRIKPEPNGTYSIPSGNLFPADGSQGRPEIYIMGVRTPHRMAIDPLDSTLYWGEVGPNAIAHPARGPTGVDEINVARVPGNYGWPYCIGDNKAYVDYDFATGASGEPYDCGNLVNDSPNNNGARNLPPARPALMWYNYGYSADWPEFADGKAMVGFFYRFDATSDAPYKLPQYFDNTLIHMEWSRNYITEIKMDSNGAPLSLTRIWTNMEWRAPIDMKIHPDGSIYVAEWGVDFQGTGSRITRIRYRLQGQDPICVITPTKKAGNLPLEVVFSAEGSTDYLGGVVNMQWDFDLDGTYDAEGITTQHTFTTPGTKVVKLTVSDQNGRSSGCTASIIAGNNPARITLNLPIPGSIFNWGDTIPYSAQIDDIEDGSTASNPPTIDCSELKVLPGLGHDRHTHSGLSFSGCSGQFITFSEGHDTAVDNVFFVLDFQYTDRGTNDVPSINSREALALHPALTLMEYFTSSSRSTPKDDPGVQPFRYILDGDWLMYADYSLLNIDSVTIRASSEAQGTLEFRIGSPTGRLVSAVPVTPTGSNIFQEVTQPITDSHQYVQIDFVVQTTISLLTLTSTPSNYPARLGLMAARNANEPYPFGDPIEFIAIQDGTEATSFYFVPPLTEIQRLRIYQLGNEESRTWGINEVIALDAEGNPIIRNIWMMNSTCNNGYDDLQLAIDGDSETFWSCEEPLASGTQNLYVVFKAFSENPKDSMTFQWFKFNGRGVAGTSTLVKAIDCGLTEAESYTGTNLVVYSADAYYAGGDAVKNVDSITRTTDDLLYGTQRVGKEFSYDIPLENNQPYQITFKFTEMLHNATGKRKFDIYCEDRLIATNVDIIKSVGSPNSAYDLERVVVLHDGTLNMKFIASENEACISAILVSKLLQSPRKTRIPGFIKASYYRNGGPGVGFFDATSGNSGGGCRADDIDLKSVGTPYDCYVTDIEEGEFIQYDLEVGVEDVFTIEFRVSANQIGTKSFDVFLDELVITDTIQFSTNGSESHWTIVSAETKSTLSPGYHMLKIISTSANWNFDSMTFMSKNGLTPSHVPLTTGNNEKRSSASTQYWRAVVLLIIVIVLLTSRFDV